MLDHQCLSTIDLFVRYTIHFAIGFSLLDIRNLIIDIDPYIGRIAGNLYYGLASPSHAIMGTLFLPRTHLHDIFVALEKKNIDIEIRDKYRSETFRKWSSSSRATELVHIPTISMCKC